MTIVHFLKKDKKVSTATIGSYKELPDPYNQVVTELLQFAFLALQKDQLVFTLADIIATCPNLSPANWYGLGLLKSAQYFKPQDGRDHESFHYLHFAIQEYMAARHIFSLSESEQLKLLNDTFWNVRYYNTWIMYVGISGGNSFVFKHFLSGNYFRMSSWLFGTSTISSKILSDPIKCLYLLHCLAEAGEHEMFSSVENIFKGGLIDLSYNYLSSNDMLTLAIVLLKSPGKQWEKLNLSYCNITDESCNVFCNMCNSQKVVVSVKSVDISYNHFHWESLSKLCNILRSWHPNELIFSIDSLYDITTVNMIDNYVSKLQHSISSNAVVTFILEKHQMIVVNAEPTYITCENFSTSFDDINEEFTGGMNATGISNLDYSIYITNDFASRKMPVLASIPNIKFCGSNLHSKGAYNLLNKATTFERQALLPHKQVADCLSGALSHSSITNTSYLNTLPGEYAGEIKEVLENFSALIEFSVENCKITDKAADVIAAVLSHNTELQSLQLYKNNLQIAGIIKITKGLKNTTKLISFSMENNNINDKAADGIASVLPYSGKVWRGESLANLANLAKF